MSPHVYPIRTRHVSVYKAYTSRWWSDANGGRGINGRPRKQERGSRKERTKKGRDPGKGRRLGGRSLIQVGNPATPSNETDRLSYLHRLASINSRGWYTNTKESPRARVYIHHVGRARGETRLLPAGNRPTNHPYICVLKGIPEYILHMLYCRLISNSIGREERPRSGETAEKEREGRRGREGECTRTLSGLTKNGFETSSRETVFLRVFVHPRRIVSPFRFERENREKCDARFLYPHLGINLFVRSSRRKSRR